MYKEQQTLPEQTALLNILVPSYHLFAQLASQHQPAGCYLNHEWTGACLGTTLKNPRTQKFEYYFLRLNCCDCIELFTPELEITKQYFVADQIEPEIEIIKRSIDLSEANILAMIHTFSEQLDQAMQQETADA